MTKKKIALIGFSCLCVVILIAAILMVKAAQQKNEFMEVLQVFANEKVSSSTLSLDRFELEGSSNQSITLYTTDSTFDKLSPYEKKELLNPILETYADYYFDKAYEYDIDVSERYAAPTVVVNSPNGKRTVYDIGGSLRTDGKTYLQHELINNTFDKNTNDKNDSLLAKNEDAIYSYIMEQFDKVTNQGEDYVPEIHDPIVLQKAADYFSISIEDVDRIFIEKAMSGY
ncbi:hypothetical protein BK120_14945 [Paenibacillus sp. FSL A5-0031]|uniref:hypothetical protein n=1 Tax=Paenibacillus sp. FSL A5-0031 TaxID=1920420 RepID=UPI00096D6069|nr:hypothetical protein [Paenibacillus sp. FSL A5-0031]OME83096.1 hypothetical protein BK120_14945 [Paenibacillus sp. FSL A5-0031]